MLSKILGVETIKALALAALISSSLTVLATAGTNIQSAFATDSKVNQIEKTAFDAEVPKIYIVYMLVDSHKGDKVKVNWVVEKAEGYKDNTVFDTAETTAPAGNIFGAFSYSKPKGGWPQGNYRADLFVDGKLEKAVKFKIGK
jgi:hypothetical protein